MTAPAAELQKAIFAALTGDAALLSLLGGAKVFDAAPADAAFPYITFGRTTAFDWSTGTETGSEQLLSLHVWSKARGRKQALAIMERCRSMLHDQALELTGHHLVNLRLEFAEVRQDDDLALQRGVMRFRAVTEQA